MTARELIEQEYEGDLTKEFVNNARWIAASHRVIERLQNRVEELERNLKAANEWPPIRDERRERYRDRLDKYVARGYSVEQAKDMIALVNKEVDENACEAHRR